MKLKKFVTTAAVALAGVACVAQSAHADLTYNPGDLFLGIRALGGVGATKDYLIDLGPASTYCNATAAIVANVALDVSATFGSDWTTRTDLVWGLFGANSTTGTVNGDAPKTMYASKAEVAGGIQSQPWKAGSSSGQGTVVTRMSAVENAYLSTAGVPNQPTVNSTAGLVQNTADTNSYASQNTYNPITSTGAISFGYFNPSIEGALTGTSYLDLYRMPVGYNVPGTYEGSFNVNGSGTVTYTPEPVPEPSCFALAGIGAALLMSARRKRANGKA